MSWKKEFHSRLIENKIVGIIDEKEYTPIENKYDFLIPEEKNHGMSSPKCCRENGEIVPDYFTLYRDGVCPSFWSKRTTIDMVQICFQNKKNVHKYSKEDILNLGAFYPYHDASSVNLPFVYVNRIFFFFNQFISIISIIENFLMNI